MTNGEKILNAFSNATIRRCKNKDFTYIEVERNDKWIADFNKEWWEAECKEPIKALEQKSKTGHWISHREHCEMNNLRPSGLGSYFWCSECGCGIDSKNFSRVNYNYCPNCGAKMEDKK